MEEKCGFLLFLLFCFIAVNDALPPKSFDVTKYGAVMDGNTDNTEAFMKTWKDACSYKGLSRVWIPKGTFMLGPISFNGSCNGPMAFVIKGTLKAPMNPRWFSDSNWIAFRYIENLTIRGGGYFDGQGAIAWQQNDCHRNSQCISLPSTLTLDFVRNSRIHHVRFINSKNTHVNMFSCKRLKIHHVKITAPADSPNTDGIRIGNSDHIKIWKTLIGTGDDCISMLSGTQDINIDDVVCGPGHGISIGSLGRDRNQPVSRITVRNTTFLGSDNGVRIKTWAPSMAMEVSDITFQDIVMKNTRNPIVIDQQYCPHNNCKLQSNSAVQIKGVTFENIRGVSDTKVAVNLQCSAIFPCKNVKLININLKYKENGEKASSQCSHVIGSAFGQQNPDGCL